MDQPARRSQRTGENLEEPNLSAMAVESFARATAGGPHELVENPSPAPEQHDTAETQPARRERRGSSTSRKALSIMIPSPPSGYMMAGRHAAHGGWTGLAPPGPSVPPTGRSAPATMRAKDVARAAGQHSWAAYQQHAIDLAHLVQGKQDVFDGEGEDDASHAHALVHGRGSRASAAGQLQASTPTGDATAVLAGLRRLRRQHVPLPSTAASQASITSSRGRNAVPISESGQDSVRRIAGAVGSVDGAAAPEFEGDFRLRSSSAGPVIQRPALSVAGLDAGAEAPVQYGQVEGSGIRPSTYRARDAASRAARARQKMMPAAAAAAASPPSKLQIAVQMARNVGQAGIRYLLPGGAYLSMSVPGGSESVTKIRSRKDTAGRGGYGPVSSGIGRESGRARGIGGRFSTRGRGPGAVATAAGGRDRAGSSGIWTEADESELQLELVALSSPETRMLLVLQGIAHLVWAAAALAWYFLHSSTSASAAAARPAPMHSIASTIVHRLGASLRFLHWPSGIQFVVQLLLAFACLVLCHLEFVSMRKVMSHAQRMERVALGQNLGSHVQEIGDAAVGAGRSGVGSAMVENAPTVQAAHAIPSSGRAGPRPATAAGAGAGGSSRPAAVMSPDLEAADTMDRDLVEAMAGPPLPRQMDKERLQQEQHERDQQLQRAAGFAACLQGLCDTAAGVLQPSYPYASLSVLRENVSLPYVQEGIRSKALTALEVVTALVACVTVWYSCTGNKSGSSRSDPFLGSCSSSSDIGAATTLAVVVMYTQAVVSVNFATRYKHALFGILTMKLAALITITALRLSSSVPAALKSGSIKSIPHAAAMVLANAYSKGSIGALAAFYLTSAATCFVFLHMAADKSARMRLVLRRFESYEGTSLVSRMLHKNALTRVRRTVDEKVDEAAAGIAEHLAVPIRQAMQGIKSMAAEAVQAQQKARGRATQPLGLVPSNASQRPAKFTAQARPSQSAGESTGEQTFADQALSIQQRQRRLSSLGVDDVGSSGGLEPGLMRMPVRGQEQESSSKQRRQQKRLTGELRDIVSKADEVMKLLDTVAPASWRDQLTVAAATAPELEPGRVLGSLSSAAGLSMLSKQSGVEASKISPRARSILLGKAREPTVFAEAVAPSSSEGHIQTSTAAATFATPPGQSAAPAAPDSRGGQAQAGHQVSTASTAGAIQVDRSAAAVGIGGVTDARPLPRPATLEVPPPVLRAAPSGATTGASSHGTATDSRAMDERSNIRKQRRRPTISIKSVGSIGGGADTTPPITPFVAQTSPYPLPSPPPAPQHSTPVASPDHDHEHAQAHEDAEAGHGAALRPAWGMLLGSAAHAAVRKRSKSPVSRDTGATAGAGAAAGGGAFGAPVNALLPAPEVQPAQSTTVPTYAAEATSATPVAQTSSRTQQLGTPGLASAGGSRWGTSPDAAAGLAQPQALLLVQQQQQQQQQQAGQQRFYAESHHYENVDAYSGGYSHLNDDRNDMDCAYEYGFEHEYIRKARTRWVAVME